MPFVSRLSKSDLNKSLNIFTLNPNTVLNNKMEVLTVQNQYTDQRYRNIATSRIKEVSLPSDLTMRIATDIVRVSEREPCGVRGCTVFIEYEEEPNNVRRIAKLKLDEEMVSTFEIYLTLRQDKRGWTALLPQFIKGLSRTVTISPDYTINKRKLYTHDSN
uniref:Protein scylla n=1 Tax=Glossina morsitans morsitans TaxID=37546 RepID=A0A1B0FG23_GLOMM